MAQITVDGWDYFYHDSGPGPLVVLLHCSNASHKQWMPLIRQLETRFRVVAPDLAGYGKSGRWPQDKPYDPLIDCRLLEQLVGRDGPIHIAGHSFGAAVGLEFARMMGDRIKSLTVIEPPAFFLLKPAGYVKEAERMREWGRKALAGIAAGDQRRAASAYMSFWLGRLRWWLMPGKMKAAIYDTMSKTGKEFEHIGSSARVPADYRGITCPTQLLVGSRTPHEAKVVTSILHKTIPNSRVIELKGAGHMSPFTHTAIVNDLIAAHIDANT